MNLIFGLSKITLGSFVGGIRMAKAFEIETVADSSSGGGEKDGGGARKQDEKSEQKTSVINQTKKKKNGKKRGKAEEKKGGDEGNEVEVENVIKDQPSGTLRPSAATGGNNVDLAKEIHSLLMSAAIKSLSRIRLKTKEDQDEIRKLEADTPKSKRKKLNGVASGAEPDQNQAKAVLTQSPENGGRIAKKRFKMGLGRGESVVNVRDLEGYRGEEDIDTLLEFLESKEASKENLPEEKTKKKKKGSKNRKKNKKRLETISPAPILAEPPTPAPTLKERSISEESELHVFAEKAGFKLNVQYDGGGVNEAQKTEEKASQSQAQDEEVPMELDLEEDGEDRVTLEVATDSGICKLILVGLTFPPEGSLTEAEVQEAIALMDKRAVELKRLAREGIITSLFV